MSNTIWQFSSNLQFFILCFRFGKYIKKTCDIWGILPVKACKGFNNLIKLSQPLPQKDLILSSKWVICPSYIYFRYFISHALLLFVSTHFAAFLSQSFLLMPFLDLWICQWCLDDWWYMLKGLMHFCDHVSQNWHGLSTLVVHLVEWKGY